MTPLVLLVGFLGSGKTTYLRRLLPALQSSGLDPHVVINDYQNAKVDAALLQDLVASVVPISGSCVCCGSREELLSALENFEHAPNRVLVVETNGTTDSEELIELLSIDPSLSRYTLPIQLSVIDGKRWQKRFWHNALELEQARTANYLFVSRTDEIDAKRAALLEESFKMHKLANTGTTPEEFARELQAISHEAGATATRDIAAHPAGCDCGHHHDEHEHHVHEEPPHYHAHGAHHFASMQLELPQHVTRASLEAFLDALPDEVIRAKGLVRLAESPGEFHVFQKVDRSVQLLPIGTNSRLGQPVAVLIGPRIPEDSVRASAAEWFGAPA
ncbi:MAG: CobW family GTP-binding protein [Chthoniobacterales bacterium]